VDNDFFLLGAAVYFVSDFLMKIMNTSASSSNDSVDADKLRIKIDR